MTRPPSLLDTLVEPGSIRTLFQPIFEVQGGSGRLHAVECLSRGPLGTNLARPDVLFNYTRRKRAERLVDRICVQAAFATAAGLFGELDERVNMSLNVHASTLGRDVEFVEVIAEEAERHGIPVPQVTVEIVEHTPSWDDPTFFRSLEELRRYGFRVALDDIGLGYCNYKMLLDCRPDYFKVDRYIVEGCADDYYRRAVLESIVQLAEKFGALVVAEGLERRGDMDAVLGLGIDLIQGYLLAAPQTEGQLLSCEFLDGRRVDLEEIRRQVDLATNVAG